MYLPKKHKGGFPMKATYNVTGDERKALVGIISEVIGTKPVYMRMPTCAYVIEGITVEKDGTMVWDERTEEATIEAVKAALQDAGYTAAEDTMPEAASDEYGLVVQMPKASFTEGSLDNLHKLVEAKGSLIKKALGVTDLPITEEDDKISFPWFTSELDADEVRSYTHFIAALCEMARNAKRVTAKEKETDNDKYAFRCFLLRLGFIGADYKTERKILLRNLSGSSAFRNGAPAKEVEVCE
jgi:hypothetical protein